jgi:hypothetical protein
VYGAFLFRCPKSLRSVKGISKYHAVVYRKGDVPEPHVKAKLLVINV